MSEGGVMCASCFPGSLKDENGLSEPVPEALEELQRKHCRPMPFPIDEKV